MNSLSTLPVANSPSLAQTKSEEPETMTAARELGAVFDFWSRRFGRLVSRCRDSVPWTIRTGSPQGCADLAPGATMQSAIATSCPTTTPSGPVEYYFNQIDPAAVKDTPYEECLSEEWRNSRDPRQLEILRRVLLRTKFPAKLIQYEEIESGIRVWPNAKDFVGEGVLILEQPTPLGGRA